MIKNKNGYAHSPTEDIEALSCANEKAGVELDLSQLPEWNLNDLYPGMDSRSYLDDVKLVESSAREFKEKYAGILSHCAANHPAELARIIGIYEAIEEKIGRISSYADLLYASHTTDPVRAKFYGDTQEKITNISACLLFFPLELNQIDEIVLQEAMANPDHGVQYYQSWIDNVRKSKPYQLDERLEQLFHDKSVTSDKAWNRLFDETVTSLRFNIDGEALSLEPALTLLQDRHENKRHKIFIEASRVLKKNIRTFALITNTLTKDKEISDRWRGFEDVADSRHLENQIERKVVEALVASVRVALPKISHRYYALKATWFGKDKLNIWDRNAPLPTSEERIFDWNEAKKIVLDAYMDFSPQMAEIADDFFKNGWIDAQNRTGKAPGAFSHPTVPCVHPYVLLNYLGKPRDVMTLAHELGHGVHQVLAGGQGTLMASTPLTLAETASVFGEMLTFQSLLAQCQTISARKEMLANKVEDMINTVVRQIAFYQFERDVHHERRNGELTTEKFGEIWLKVQRESLGSAFKFDENYKNFWAYIPHFIHSPFYVYAYAFGECLVNSLYAVYQSDGVKFQDKYLDMLRAGGSKSHRQLLKPFGLDAGEATFWSKGLSLISDLIDALESLEK